MSEKTLNTRIIHKHDTEINWSKATNFIPKKGEIIIYDKDNNYNYERIKVGDGTTLVNNLPFYGSSIENILDGIASGSVRTSSSTTESTDYKLGTAAFAEGKDTKAKGNYSHAEGYSTTASGAYSHAEGRSSTASGSVSHAEGTDTVASGIRSHASGWGTIAKGENQTAIGKYNVEDTNEKYALIVGNGTSTARSNAFTVDWSGNAEAGGKKLATETYVEGKIAGIPTPDVSGQIETHNSSSTAHSDIRQSISEKANNNDLTSHIGDSNIHTSATEKAYWNAKASTDIATKSANGLMSSIDKSKLDGIESGANKTTVDSSLSSTSTNPVQNKVIKTELDKKQQGPLVGSTSEITPAQVIEAVKANRDVILTVPSVTLPDGGIIDNIILTTVNTANDAAVALSMVWNSISFELYGNISSGWSEPVAYYIAKSDELNSKVKLFIVTVTESNGNYTADKTLEEIHDALISHKMPICQYGPYVFTYKGFFLAHIFEGSIDGTLYKIRLSDEGVYVTSTELASTDVATTGTNGLMSAGDKGKLDDIEKGANKTTVDAALDTKSTNPVENQAITNWLAKNVKNYRIALGGAAGSRSAYAYLTSEAVSPAAAAPDNSPVYAIEDYPIGVLWSNIADKPSTFPPSSHKHNYNTDITNKPTIPSKTSQLTNDSGYITSAPVTSVNGKTGAVTLSASDVGALPSSTQIPSISGLATETYVNNKVAGIVNSAPEALDTLNELAAALGDDPHFATTIATQIGGKVDKVNGKGLSTNDYTTTEKNKLAGIANNANNYTHPNTHPATMITEDATHRFVTDAEKAAWNKSDVFIATYDTTTNAEMEAALDAGKIVFVSMNNKIFIPLMYRFGSKHIFVQLKPRDNGSTVDQAIMVECSDNIWSSTPIQIIPLVTTSDKGKVLMVNESGSWAATSITKPAITATTLLASSWDSTAKTYNFESTYPNASYDIEVALDSTATSEQAEAFNGAQIVGSATSNIIKAYGDVPTVDIPIILKVVNK